MSAWTLERIAEFTRDYAAPDALDIDDLTDKYGVGIDGIRWRAKTLNLNRHPDFVRRMNANKGCRGTTGKGRKGRPWSAEKVAAFVCDYTARDGLPMEALMVKYSSGKTAIEGRAKRLKIHRHPEFRIACSTEAGAASGRVRRGEAQSKLVDLQPLEDDELPCIFDDTWPAGRRFEDDPREAARPFRPIFLPIWRIAA